MYVPSNLKIAEQFCIKGQPISIKEFGSGHINDTYRILTDVIDGPEYLLQRINNFVFKDVDILMNNIQKVTEHLHQKLSDDPDIQQKVLTVIPTRDGKLYFVDEADNYWRLMILIKNTRSYDIVETQSQAEEGGRAFGNFQALLADMNPSEIDFTIPNFCNIDFRLQNFHLALDQDIANRKKDVKEEINYIIKREDKMNSILEMAARGELPLRITHNDTKFNNVLLDQNDQAQCVIDLDTVMPGYVAYDFGDAIRTIINRAAEDEADTSTIQLNIPLFKAYTKGYFEAAHGFLTVKEVDSLLQGVLLFPYMQSVRFLTDYLEGDKYYKIQHEAHNLQRTRAQLKLAYEIELHRSELEDIITVEAAKYSLLADKVK